MDMYDEQGNPVTDFDPAKGRLEMQKRMHHHEAVEAVEEQGHWETVAEYPAVSYTHLIYRKVKTICVRVSEESHTALDT